MDMRIAVETPRLRLVPCDLELAEAVLADRPKAERMLGATLHPDWPGQDTRGFLPIHVGVLRRHPGEFIWGVWLMLLVEPSDGQGSSGAGPTEPKLTVIGDLGYKGPPGHEGIVDLGYGIVLEMRRKGYTFEAARALVDWAFAHPEVTSVTAECNEDNAGSVRILEKLGMSRVGKNGRLILWSLRRSPL